MNNLDYLLFPLFTLFGAFGSYFFKKSDIQLKIPAMLFNPYIYIGCIFYLASAVINIRLLQEFPYIIVLPCSSLTYVWTFFLSYLILKEKIGYMKICGISLILAGAIFVAMG